MLPAGFLYAGNLSLISQFAEADSADTIFSEVCMRTAADPAAVIFSCGELLLALLFDFHCCLSHEYFLLT